MLDFRIHAKFLRGKNRGDKRLFCSPTIPILPAPLITVDGNGRSRREGLGERIHIITVKNVA